MDAINLFFYNNYKDNNQKWYCDIFLLSLHFLQLFSSPPFVSSTFFHSCNTLIINSSFVLSKKNCIHECHRMCLISCTTFSSLNSINLTLINYLNLALKAILFHLEENREIENLFNHFRKYTMWYLSPCQGWQVP